MGIETALADRKGKDFCELPKVTNSNNKTRKSRRRQKKMSPVQKLFETCKEVFASASTGIVPPSEDIQRLRSVLDDMKPEDVGLTPELLYFNPLLRSRTPAITYLHLYECENFSVFHKLLYMLGDFFYTTPNARLAKIKVDSDFTAPCNASILYPADGGNMHRFTAVTACAVLDVLGPPYSDPDGRHCTYYHDFPFSEFSVEGVKLPEGEEEQKENYAWLQERILPEGLAVRGAPYTGPKIVE
ncbi:hypothetical protein F8388_025527 [Cannabis sativa]|uniref:cysteine dioxygenase n=1 Tax=Cannabis sativa TaxID=3483 RepID=A0A7J6DXS2_CANSA|nr:hypothetical protein G4B88_029094 [Cannabis sativa]KAF4376656.1 hypothetical protein F8388_025527 [Cannabis sativa]KAF4390732.1 hypothetical protein G4B88_015622 [Cannabis sativa]